MENATLPNNTHVRVMDTAPVNNVSNTALSSAVYELTTSESATWIGLTDVTHELATVGTLLPATTLEATVVPTNYVDHVTHGNYIYEDYIYPGYTFERPVYLYIWEILVIVTFLVNLIVISVLLRRKMRNATNMILVAIAVSDSLTGLVTLPSYIMVYQRYDPLQNDDYSYYGMKHSVLDDYTNSSMNQSQSDYQYGLSGFQDQYGLSGFQDQYGLSGFQDQYLVYFNGGEFYYYQYNTSYPNAFQTDSQFLHSSSVDGYVLTKSLCRGFMISKYFLSKSFHTISIFLTLFLGVQRYVSMAYPFKSHSLFSVKRIIICCVIIFIASPILNTYHLGSEKAIDGLCQWELSEIGCGGGCIYLWIVFVLRHFIPCITLVVFTVLFIRQLRLGEMNLRRMNSNQSQMSRRVEENRRISFIVTAIVVVFLIPEIPYGTYLLYNAIKKTTDDGTIIDTREFRAVHMSYEILLVLSFHANIYIYTLFNRKFRKCLYGTFIYPIWRRLVHDETIYPISRTSSSSRRTSTRKTECVSSKAEIGLRALRSNSCDKSATMDTKFIESFSADVTHKSHPDSHELEALNAKV